jgi:hypothetical protein
MTQVVESLFNKCEALSSICSTTIKKTPKQTCGRRRICNDMYRVKSAYTGWAWWLVSIISATREAEIGRITV